MNATGNSCLNVWIDWNQDGDLAGEQVLTNVPVLAGNNDLVVNVPGNVDNQSLYARIRLTPEDNSGGCNNAEAYAAGVATPWGAAAGGEVEDYHWFLSPTAARRGDRNRYVRRVSDCISLTSFYRLAPMARSGNLNFHECTVSNTRQKPASAAIVLTFRCGMR